MEKDKKMTATASPGENKERLKARFLKTALNSFQKHETIEFVLTYAMPRSYVSPVAKRLLKTFKGLRGVFDATCDELRVVEGMTENAVVLIGFLKEMATLYLRERIMGKDVISTKKDVLEYLNLSLSGERVEKFIALFLNARNELLAIETLHEGTINQTVVYPRKVIERAFKNNAHSVIFVHNHPSGDPAPSAVDRQLTGILHRAAIAVDLVVQDHIIIGRDKHFSGRESGWFNGGARPFGRRVIANKF
ncbi:MAG: DNA repair protein RadC [Thermodesulfobacteriota bacterium]